MATAHVFEYSTTAPGSYGEGTSLFQEPANTPYRFKVVVGHKLSIVAA